MLDAFVVMFDLSFMHFSKSTQKTSLNMTHFGPTKRIVIITWAGIDDYRLFGHNKRIVIRIS